VGPDAERQVLARWAGNVELLSVSAEPLFVAVGRTDQRQDRAAFRNGLAVVLHIAGDVPRCLQRRRLEPQDFFDGSRQQSSVGCQSAALIGIVGQQLSRPADQAGGGFSTGDVDDSFRLTFTARSSGKHVEMDLVEIYTIRDGLIIKLDVYYKDPSAVAALIAG
jgi:hypothetical protein